MNFFTRHKNTVVLAILLLGQLLALAVQVKRQTTTGPVRIIRLVAVSAMAPVGRMMTYTREAVRGGWEDYIDLRGVRKENHRLRAENARLLLEQTHEAEEVRQAHRLQALLQFKQRWIDTTVAAQVIGTGGMESSRLLYLDKGAEDGIRRDMPVITPQGVVGKILNVYGNSSQVLLINDATSGVGAILSDSRLQGVVKGTPSGDLVLSYIMSGETVKPGEQIVTSGGDRVYPKGLPIGTVIRSGPGRGLFLDIEVAPAADLNRLEEVLIITRQAPRARESSDAQAASASEILAEQLPGIPQEKTPAAGSTAGSVKGEARHARGEKPQTRVAKPEGRNAKPGTHAVGPARPNPKSDPKPNFKSKIKSKARSNSGASATEQGAATGPITGEAGRQSR